MFYYNTPKELKYLEDKLISDNVNKIYLNKI